MSSLGLSIETGNPHLMPTQPSGKPVDHTEVVGHQRSEPVAPLEERLRRGGFDPVAAMRLEAIHSARGDWAEVARLVAAQAEHLLSVDERAAALARAAGLHRTRLADRPGALRVLKAAFDASPAEPAVAEELEAIAREDVKLCGKVRALYADSAGPCALGAPDLATELWLRAAEIDLAVARDAGRAVEALSRAIHLVPGSLSHRAGGIVDRLERETSAPAVLDALAELCRRGEDRTRLARILGRSIEHAADVGDRSRRLRAFADLLREDGEVDGADWYEREALRLSPLGQPIGADLDHDRDAAILGERLMREKRWPAAEQVLMRLVRPGGLAAERLGLSRADLHYRAGRVALELGKFQNAIRFYKDALEFDPVNLPALVEQARAAAALERWGEAYELLCAAHEVQRSQGRPPVEQAETLYQMGRAREKNGYHESALTLYESALDGHPAHPGALRAACELHRAAGDLSSVQRLLRVAISAARGATRAALQVELAGIRSRFFSDADGAVALCRDALALAPGDPRALLALAEHCQAAGAWADAARALAELGEIEDSLLRSGRYFQLAGAAAENAVTANAISYYERALDCFFGPGRVVPDAMRAGCMRAFDDCERLLRERRDWKGLERAYRGMIKRMGAGAAELPRLWAGLGAIYKEHLGHRASAIQSFEVASELEKDRLTHHRILIDLYSGVESDELDKLVERRLKLVHAEPFNPDHYAALRSLWAKMKLWDRTFAACRALVFLGRADRKEDEFYRRYRTDSVVWPRRGMSESDWNRLRHPDEDPLISAVMALVAEPIALSHAMTARRLRLDDDSSAAHDHMRHLYRNACAALAIGTPRLFVAPWLEVDVVLANLKVGAALAPSFAVGRHMYQGRSSAQMVHGMARALSYARPAAYLRLLLGGNGELGTALAAARAAAVRPGSTEGVSLDERVSRLHGAMAKRARQPVWVAELRGALRRLRERGGAGPVDLDRWGRSVDATARRAGLLLAGGLDVAAADLDREALFAQRTSREKRLCDLLLHSVSEEHFALRKDLGLALDD